MSVCEELSILDLLKEQVPGCVNCLPYSPPVESASDADPILNDIFTFVRTLIPGEAKDEHTLPSHPRTKGPPQVFFGISLGKEVECGLEQLTCYIQSQVSPQPHSLKPQKPPATPDYSTVHSGVTIQSHAFSSSIQLSSDCPPQLSPVKCSDQQSLHPTNHLDHPVLKTPINRMKPLHSPYTPKLYPHLSSHKQASSVCLDLEIFELELHPSPSQFFNETQKEKRITTGLSQKSIGISEIPKALDQRSEKYLDKPYTSVTEDQIIYSNPDCKESQSKNHSYSKKSQEVKSPTLVVNHSVNYTLRKDECQIKTDLVYRKDQATGDSNSSRNKENGNASPSKGKNIKLGQSSSKDQVSPSTNSSKGQTKDDTRSSKGQTVDDTKASKGQTVDDTKASKGQTVDDTKASKGQTKDEIKASKGQTKDEIRASKGQTMDDTKASKGQAMDDTKASKGQKAKTSRTSNKGYIKTSPTSNKGQEVRARTDSSRAQKVKSLTNSSRILEVKVAQTSSKGQVKGGTVSHIVQEFKNGSSSRKVSNVKAAPKSDQEQEILGSSKSSKGNYKQPFMSTDEQENKDNEVSE